MRQTHTTRCYYTAAQWFMLVKGAQPTMSYTSLKLLDMNSCNVHASTPHLFEPKVRCTPHGPILLQFTINGSKPVIGDTIKAHQLYKRKQHVLCVHQQRVLSFHKSAQMPLLRIQTFSMMQQCLLLRETAFSKHFKVGEACFCTYFSIPLLNSLYMK